MRVKFHGYDFGDRILEDVYFQADIDNGQVSNVAIDPASDGYYWDDLNQSKWLRLAKEHLEVNLKNSTVQQLEADGIVEILP
jgi:hypothetical protein